MLSEDELYDWMAAYSLDPWGPERAELSRAIIAATIVNVQRDPRKGKPVSPEVFMPRYGQPNEMASPETMKAKLLSAFGSRIKRRKPNGEG